jgi:hypothetical protein
LPLQADRNFGEKPGQIMEDFLWGGNSVAKTAEAGIFGERTQQQLSRVFAAAVAVGEAEGDEGGEDVFDAIRAGAEEAAGEVGGGEKGGGGGESADFRFEIWILSEVGSLEVEGRSTSLARRVGVRGRFSVVGVGFGSWGRSCFWPFLSKGPTLACALGECGSVC